MMMALARGRRRGARLQAKHVREREAADGEGADLEEVAARPSQKAIGPKTESMFFPCLRLAFARRHANAKRKRFCVYANKLKTGCPVLAGRVKPSGLSRVSGGMPSA